MATKHSRDFLRRDNMNRALLIKQIRLKAGLTQKELGEIMNADRTIVTKWEGGQIEFEDSRMFELLHICSKKGLESFNLEQLVIDIMRKRERC